jgi:ankyrin repeat protein
MTPLMMAAMFERTDWVKLFIERGANVNATTGGVATALGLSKVFGGQPDIERLLREAGAH